MSKQQARNFECYVLISPWTSAAEELQSVKRRKNVCKNGNLIAKSIFKCQQYNENSYNMAKKTTEKIMGQQRKQRLEWRSAENYTTISAADSGWAFSSSQAIIGNWKTR